MGSYKGTILTKEEENNICDEYTNTDINIATLASKYKVGPLKIRNILKDNNISAKKQGTDMTQKLKEFTPKLFTPSDKDHILIAECKKTGKTYTDVNNKVSTLTNHIKEHFPDAEIVSTVYARKKFEFNNGYKWYEKYFTIKEIEKGPVKRCPYCDWETKDIDNLSGQFQVHLEVNHNKTVKQYLKDFPDDIDYFNKYKRKIEESKALEKDHVTCQECGKKLKAINTTHLTTHNMTLLDYKLKYPNIKFNSESFTEKLKNIYEKKLKYHSNTITTKPHKEICDLLSEFGIEYEINNKIILDGYEIDIVIPSLKIGIEYNGLYYHGERNGKTQYSHLNKTLNAKKQGYKLYHIFEDEWVNNKDITTHKIKHLLGLSEGIKIGGRKCKIKEITPNLKKIFLEKYHIQGPDKSNIHLGAFYGDKLLAVMTFNNKNTMTNNIKDGTYELSRFAVDYNYIVSGIASKLLKYFIKNYTPKSIISYADRRWTLDADNNLYTKLGFELVKTNKPDYKYFNAKYSRNKRIHKFNFGKKSIKTKYPEIYNDNKTENEMMVELGFDRIWDCGMYKYELKLD